MFSTGIYFNKHIYIKGVHSYKPGKLSFYRLSGCGDACSALGTSISTCDSLQLTDTAITEAARNAR